MSRKQILRSYRYQIIGVKIYFLTIIIIIIIIIKIWFDEQTDRQPGWCGVRWGNKRIFSVDPIYPLCMSSLSCCSLVQHLIRAGDSHNMFMQKKKFLRFEVFLPSRPEKIIETSSWSSLSRNSPILSCPASLLYLWPLGPTASCHSHHL